MARGARGARAAECASRARALRHAAGCRTHAHATEATRRVQPTGALHARAAADADRASRAAHEDRVALFVEAQPRAREAQHHQPREAAANTTAPCVRVIFTQQEAAETQCANAKHDRGNEEGPLLRVARVHARAEEACAHERLHCERDTNCRFG